MTKISTNARTKQNYFETSQDKTKIETNADAKTANTCIETRQSDEDIDKADFQPVLRRDKDQTSERHITCAFETEKHS